MTQVHISKTATLNGTLFLMGKNGLADKLLPEDPGNLGLIFCSIIHLMWDLKV